MREFLAPKSELFDAMNMCVDGTITDYEVRLAHTQDFLL
jgi:hypothetical protein